MPSKHAPRNQGELRLYVSDSPTQQSPSLYKIVLSGISLYPKINSCAGLSGMSLVSEGFRFWVLNFPGVCSAASNSTVLAHIALRVQYNLCTIF